jgi:hypothetical protein
MSDDTEQARRAMLATGQPQADLSAEQGQSWTTQQLTADFEVKGYMPLTSWSSVGQTARLARWSSLTHRGSTSAGGRTSDPPALE